MNNFREILNIVEETFELLKLISYKYKNENINLRYISDSIEDFDMNLLNYGVSKESLINHVSFELYSEITQQEVRINKDSISLDSLLKRYLKYIGDDNRDSIKNHRSKNAIPYLKKYKYLNYDNMLEQQNLNSKDLLWKRMSIQRNIFYNNNIADKFNVEINSNNRYDNIMSFQQNYYSYIMCKYTEKNKIMGKFSEGDFSKIKLGEYVDFVKELYEFIKDKEEDKNISYYIIEKEFNPILIKNILCLINDEELNYKAITSLWYISTIPDVVSKNMIDKIVSEQQSYNQSGIERKYNRYPIGKALGIIRIYKEFIPLLYLIAEIRVGEKYKEELYKNIKHSKNEFKKMYINLEEELDQSLKVLKNEINKKRSEQAFKYIMESKEIVYNSVKEIIAGVTLYTSKVSELDKNNENDLLECIYIKEDNKYIVDNNDFLKIISGFDGKL